MEPSSPSDPVDPTVSIPESGGTSEHQIAQLLRLPGRSGLALSPSSPIYTKELEGHTMTMYTNQVGGHRVLVKPKDSSVVLKPYDEAEYNFYDQCMPVICSSLLPFTAQCFGEVDLRMGTPDHAGQQAGNLTVPGKSGKYVMLEDLAHGIAKPCILDLKMGLKQRSIRNFSDKKMQSKEAKSKSTTSHLVGFRLCGAQLYRGGDDSIVFYNKYFGRLQDVEGTYSVLTSFFESLPDPSSRAEIITTFISKLTELRSVITSLNGFRFWSGSLLFVFDSGNPKSVILKMIDFANYTQLDPKTGFDQEYVFGIECLIEFLQGVKNAEPVAMVMKRIPPPPDPRVQDAQLVQAVEAYGVLKSFP